MYIYIYITLCVYIYIYMYLQTHILCITCVCVYIYIYILLSDCGHGSEKGLSGLSQNSSFQERSRRKQTKTKLEQNNNKQSFGEFA